MSLTPVGFALKLSKGDCIVLLKEKGAKPLRYFSKGHVKKNYIILPRKMRTDIKELRCWVKKSMDYVK